MTSRMLHRQLLSYALQLPSNLYSPMERYAIVPEMIQSPRHTISTETWLFNFDERTLVNANKKAKLTTIESLLLKNLLSVDQKVFSKIELIIGIDRDPDSYRGLEMCLSRLQDKFSSITGGERLLKSVRNKGYWVIQSIAICP